MDVSGFVARFERVVAETPQAVAAIFGTSLITFMDLNQRANQLARCLIAAGVRKDVIAAIYADRSIDFLVGVIAVFKAGGAYLPLDPTAPARRNIMALSSAEARVLLCDTPARLQVDALAADVAVQVIALEVGTDRDSSNLGIYADPADLAYVIFTSGSSGAPKGAMVEHRGMLNHLDAKLFALEFKAGDALIQNAAQCFDISVWQFLSPLLVGATVHIVPTTVARDPRLLFAYAAEQRISVLEVVPSLLRAALLFFDGRVATLPELTSLRWLIVTGETLAPDLCRSWLHLHPTIPLINAYGPTECSDDVTHHVIATPPPSNTMRIPIGLPIAKALMYIVRENVWPLERCDAGSAGELCIGGLPVGRGYINDPARTARAFLDDPFSPRGGRLYRTGDLVKALPDGSYDFLGRIDRQVKIRGNRIELEEIEFVLRKHPCVRDCVVVVKQESSRDSATLVAYFVPNQQSMSEEIRAFVKNELAAYSVPDRFVALTELPLTSNGKIDIASLPASEEFLEPPSAVGVFDRMATLWSTLLGILVDDRETDFFEHGGSSILALQLLSRIKKNFAVEVEFQELLDNSRIKAFAELVDAKLSGAKMLASIPTKPKL